MFGGLAFLAGGNMAVAASGQGGLLVRVDPGESKRLVATTPAEEMVMRGRSMKGWLRLDSADVQGGELDAWVERGLAFAVPLLGEALTQMGLAVAPGRRANVDVWPGSCPADRLAEAFSARRGRCADLVDMPAYIVDNDLRFRWQNAASRALVGDLRGRLDLAQVAPEDLPGPRGAIRRSRTAPHTPGRALRPAPRRHARASRGQLGAAREPGRRDDRQLRTRSGAA